MTVVVGGIAMNPAEQVTHSNRFLNPLLIHPFDAALSGLSDSGIGVGYVDNLNVARRTRSASRDVGE